MLSVLLFVPLFLCNAQWTQQSLGEDDVEPVLEPLDQTDDPYHQGPQWVENIPNLSIIDTAFRKSVPKTSKIFNKQYVQQPKSEKQGILNLLNDIKISNNSETSKIVGTTYQENSLKTSEYPISSVFSKVGNKVALPGRSSVRHQVTDLANQEPSLRNVTDQFMDQFNLLYLNLATDEDDNEVRIENFYKYGMSVILRFLLEFYRIFRKLSSNESQLRITNVDVYGISYDKAVAVMKDKKEFTPLQISAPVRRSAEIFKSILYESVVMVQTKCSTLDPNWKCIIVYLANLISEAMNCSNIWYHALVHILALDNIRIQDNFVYKIAHLDKFKEFAYFENIFEFIIEKIQEYREVGRVQLSAEAVFFTMLADLQENGLLDCLYIDHLYD